MNVILDRVKSAKNIDSDAKLAEFLGVKRNVISMWRKRNTLDYQKVVTRCEDLDLNWLLTSTPGEHAPLVVVKEPRARYQPPGRERELIAEVSALREEFKKVEAEDGGDAPSLERLQNLANRLLTEVDELAAENYTLKGQVVALRDLVLALKS